MRTCKILASFLTLWDDVDVCDCEVQSDSVTHWALGGPVTPLFLLLTECSWFCKHRQMCPTGVPAALQLPHASN